MAWFPTINLVSDQVTQLWTYCLCFPNNGWRSSRPDKRSEPFPSTYCELSIRSGTLSCSPNSLIMVSKAISTHGLRTCSPVAVNAWLLTEFSHALFLSRLEFLEAVFWALCFFWFSSRIFLTLWKILYLLADDSTLCFTIPHPSDWQTADSSLSANLDELKSWLNTWNMNTSFNPDISHSHCLSERTV